MDEQDFEWDLEKAALNAIKHGISFLEARSVFSDPDVLRIDVTKPEYGERRVMAVGHVGQSMVSVIYTERSGRRRIISARRARRNERKQYREGAESS